MTQAGGCIVVFVGGPADGHVEPLPHTAATLPEEFIWFVSENFFRLLDGQDAGPQRPATSVAVYERVWRKGQCRYEFLGSISPHYLSTRSPPAGTRCAARPGAVGAQRAFPAPPPSDS